ncbi:hypothetical protein D3C81_2200120 [compost metagenome]
MSGASWSGDGVASVPVPVLPVPGEADGALPPLLLLPPSGTGGSVTIASFGPGEAVAEGEADGVTIVPGTELPVG